MTPLPLLAPGELRNNDLYDNLTFSMKLGVDVNQNLAFNFIGRYTTSTLMFTGDDFSVLPSVPAATQSEQVIHEYFTRGETVATFLDGRFKNYFGINYADTYNFDASPGSADTTNVGKRLKFDYSGVIVVYEGALFIVSVLVHSGTTAFTPSIVGRILAINAAAFVGLLVIDRLGARSGLRGGVKTPPLTAGGLA